MSDPRVRRDGKCYVCKGVRPDVAIKDRDPFCSTECARKYHGVPIPPPAIRPPKEKG